MVNSFLKNEIEIKHPDFSKNLIRFLKQKQLRPSPSFVALSLNQHFKTSTFRSHTVRKWLIGETQPKSETLLLLANWLKVEPSELISKFTAETTTSNKVSFEFDFTDQEVISKYLSMTVNQKVTVRLLIDAITDKDR